MRRRIRAFLKNKYSAWITIALLFALSIIIRLPQLNQPLHMGHQWSTAHVLVTLRIWADEGISRYNYNPVYTYNTPADKHLKSLTSGIQNEQGDYFYVSYPPLTFLFPFVVFKALRVEPGILPLQIFSLALHGISSLLVYVLISSLYGLRLRDGIFAPALVACGVYLFMPLALWYHMNVYFADMLVQPLWLASTCLAYQLFERNRLRSSYHLVCYGGVNFLSIYTEWLAVFAAFVLILIAGWRYRHNKSYSKVIITIATSTLLALGLILLQYSSIAGLDSFLLASIERFFSRSGLNDGGFLLSRLLSYALIGQNYWVRYFPIFLLLVFFLLTLLATHKRGTIFSRFGTHRFMLVILTVPILLHHIIFFEFTLIHEFSEIKSGVLFSYLTAALFHHSRFTILPEARRYFYSLSFIVTAIIFALCMYVYKQQAQMDDTWLHAETGLMIKKTAMPDETIYLTGGSTRSKLIDYRIASTAVSAQPHYWTLFRDDNHVTAT